MFFSASLALKLLQQSAIVTFSAMTFSAMAAEPRIKSEFENRLASVKTLNLALSRDPGAGSGEIMAVIATVAARQREAEELASVGEYDAAQLILNEGYKILTRTLAATKSGTGYTGPSGSAAAKVVADDSRKASYERIVGSARALLSAAQRASLEVGGLRSGDVARIETVIDLSEQASRHNDYVRAESLANDAMNELRPLLASMKGSARDIPAVKSTGGQDSTRQFAAFDSRMDSAKALVAALKRINKDRIGGEDVAIADIEDRLQRAEAIRGNDPATAQALLDTAYNMSKLNLQSMQVAPTLKSGSAAPEAAEASSADMDLGRSKIELVLKSSGILREALDRIGREKGVDNSAALARIDALSAEARSRQESDPARALHLANEANQAAKNLLRKLSQQ